MQFVRFVIYVMKGLHLMAGWCSHTMDHLSCLWYLCSYLRISYWVRDPRARDRMVVEFTTTCAISDYHH